MTATSAEEVVESCGGGGGGSCGDADVAAEKPLEVAADRAAWEPLNWRGVEILAPMVRASTLALRLECLRYGADLVYGEEIIDKKILGAIRVENPAFGTVDYITPRERMAFFTTRPEEKSRLIFQVGTADPSLAAEAALTVHRDVRGVDVNMGCPKSFSVKGGMGAALLSKPEVASDILKSLRRSLPSSCAVTCKIRMLATTEKTREFMRCCEASGAEAITVHMRVRDERPAHPAHWDEIVRLWDAVKVPVVANGDFFSRRQIDEFWKHVHSKVGHDDPEALAATSPLRGPSGIMIARGALWNPSIFLRERGLEPPSFEEVVRSYTSAAVKANATFQNTKWVLNQFISAGTGVMPPTHFAGVPMKGVNKRIGTARSMAGICEVVGVPFSAEAWPTMAHMTYYYRDGAGSAPLAEAAAAAGVDLASFAGAPVGGKRIASAAGDAAAAAPAEKEEGQELPTKSRKLAAQ